MTLAITEFERLRSWDKRSTIFRSFFVSGGERNLFLVSVVRRESQAIHLRHEPQIDSHIRSPRWIQNFILLIHSTVQFREVRCMAAFWSLRDIMLWCWSLQHMVKYMGEMTCLKVIPKTINAHRRDNPVLTNKSRYLNRMWGKLSSYNVLHSKYFPWLNEWD